MCLDKSQGRLVGLRDIRLSVLCCVLYVCISVEDMTRGAELVRGHEPCEIQCLIQ